MSKNRTGRLVRSLLAASAVAPLVMTAVACGSAPTDESSSSTSQEIAIGCNPAPHPGAVNPMCVSPIPTITPIPSPIPTITPIPFPILNMTCSWDAMSSAYVTTTHGFQLWGESSSVQSDGCLLAGGSAWNDSAIKLMKAGCSAPFLWEAWNPGTNSAFNVPLDSDVPMNQANAHALLCPANQGLEAEVTAIGCSEYPGGCPEGSNYVAPHPTSTFSDDHLPLPLNGWFYAVVWEDPTCPSGCMLDDATAM